MTLSTYLGGYLNKILLVEYIDVPKKNGFLAASSLWTISNRIMCYSSEFLTFLYLVPSNSILLWSSNCYLQNARYKYERNSRLKRRVINSKYKQSRTKDCRFN